MNSLLRDWTPFVLTVLVVVGFFAALWYVVTGDQSGANREVALMMLGALVAAFGNIVQYFFGSSAGSRQKTDIMGSGK